MKETYLSRDFRETAAQRFSSHAEYPTVHGRSGGSIDWAGIGKEEAIETEIGTFMELLFAAKRLR